MALSDGVRLSATINNCAFTGSYNNIKSFNNIGFSYNAPTKVTVSGFYSNASEVFVANVNHGTRLYVPSSSYPTSIALVKNNDGETFYSAFSDALAAWTDGSTLALLADVTCDSMISVPAADTKTLDLNGNALSLSYSSTKVEVNGTLTIQSTASGGSITPTTKSRVINVVDGGTLNIESGTINGYNADRAVIGGVGTINLNGGKIATPASNAFSPDGVATLNLNGGEIECTSDSTSMGTASAVWANGNTTVNWNGTAITTNTGDGIRMKSAGNGTVNVTGGSFTATSSSLPEEGGYAIYCNSNMGTLNLEGNPSISGRGIYLTNDKVINITDDLSNTNPISVTMQTPGVFTSGLSGNGDASNFANGNGTGYAITLNASGEAQIVSTYTITWKNYDDTEIGASTVIAGETPAFSDEIGEIKAKPEDDDYTYTFSGWTPELTAATADAEYTATFDATPKAVPAKLTINVGENGKVVMDNGTFGNATDASNIVDITAPFNITDGSNVFIVDDHTANLVEGGSINIATGGELSFYPSADNTGVITAIPDEGYFCTGWYDGDTLYSSGAALAYQNISEDITLTAKFAPEQDIFTKHSITLNGTVDENFFIDPEGAGYTVDDIISGAKTITVSFGWSDGVIANTDLSAFDVTIDSTNYADYLKTSGAMAGQLMVTCKVAAAEMTCDVKATATVSDGTNTIYTQEDDYSVREYCMAIINAPDNTFEDQDKLVELAKAMLDYGAQAQKVFNVKTADLANKEISYQPELPAGVNTVAEAIDVAKAADPANSGKTTGDLNAVADSLGITYYGASLIYLDKSTLRIYFTDVSGAAENWAWDGYKVGSDNKKYYYVQVQNIAAAELDDLQEFNLNGTKFYYSALDYVKAVLASNNMTADQKQLATATYFYNKAANAYFPAPVAPAPAETVIDLSTLPGAYEAQDGDVLTGTLEGNKQITIADGATVTLRNVDITSLTNAAFAGITPLGDATILLEGTNFVKGGVSGGYADYPGIFVPENTTLTIDGTGSLTASKGDDNGYGGGCGIGGGYNINAGNIEIKGGNITAIGGYGSAGIGGGCLASCSAITINGGTVNATGGEGGAGIGSGCYGGSCGSITIADTVTQVTATAGEGAASIGAGYSGTCGTVTIGGIVYQDGITTSPYPYEPN